jgi:hypothetical protein
MADETFLTPLIDRDLISAPIRANAQMGMPMGMGGFYNPYMNTNLLGGVTMMPNLSYDVYGAARQARRENLNGLKNIAIGVGGFLGACIAGTKLNKLFKSIGKLFKK